jgi:tetratricopeptide (TPR) repeat protein
LFAQAGDLEAWRQDGGLMLRRFAGTSDPVIATRIAEVCLIRPPPDDELGDIGKMVDIAMTANSPHKTWSDVYFVKGLAEYRLGRFAGAVEWLKKTEPEKGQWPRLVEVQAVLAMAQQHLGQTEEALATAADALQTAARYLPKLDEVRESHWNDWIMAHLLLNEAQAGQK